MSNHHDYYLEQLGLQKWINRQPSTQMGLSQLALQAESCRACTFHRHKTNTAFSNKYTGDCVKLMIIGDAPGYNADQQGQSIVGKSLLLLRKMLQCIGLDDTQVYITNLLKCRPPENQNVVAGDFKDCSKFFKQQVELIKPRAIWSFGLSTAHFFSNTSNTLEMLRTHQHEYSNIPVVLGYHPDYLMKNPEYKKEAFKDLYELSQIIEPL